MIRKESFTQDFYEEARDESPSSEIYEWKEKEAGVLRRFLKGRAGKVARAMAIFTALFAAVGETGPKEKFPGERQVGFYDKLGATSPESFLSNRHIKNLLGKPFGESVLTKFVLENYSMLPKLMEKIAGEADPGFGLELIRLIRTAPVKGQSGAAGSAIDALYTLKKRVVGKRWEDEFKEVAAEIADKTDPETLLTKAKELALILPKEKHVGHLKGGIYRLYSFENYIPILKHYNSYGEFLDRKFLVPYLEKAVERNPRQAFIYLKREDIPELWNFVEQAVALEKEAWAMPGRPITDRIPPEKLRVLIRMANNLARDHLPTGQKYGFISIPDDRFEHIYFSLPFQAALRRHEVDLNYMNSFSLAHAVYRSLSRDWANFGNLKDREIEKAAEEIFGEVTKARSREILGPATKLILITGDEDRFDEPEILRMYFRAGGKKEHILATAKGIAMENGKNQEKEKILAAVRSAKSGTVTILFDGHGSSVSWALSLGSIPKELLGSNQSSVDLQSISYKELGDAMIRSGNIRNFNLVASTCFAFDFYQRMFEYLEEVGVREKPGLSVSAGNYGRYGFGGAPNGFFRMGFYRTGVDSVLLNAMQKASKSGEPIKAGRILDAEGKIWMLEDPAIFIGRSGKKYRGHGEPKNYLEISMGLKAETEPA